MRPWMIILPLALAMLLGGCVKASVTSPDIQRPSLTQELGDLQAARDSGAITSAQYDQLSRRIAANYDKFAPPRKKTFSYHWP